MLQSSVTPQRLLAAFDEQYGAFAKLLISPSPGFHQPPALLPGETPILQQDKVTCVKTLSQAATGCLHLTNYRIIFKGNYMNKNKLHEDFNKEYLEKFGYKYQKSNTLKQRIKRLVPNNALKDKLKKFGVHVSSSSDSISGMLSVDALLPERSWTDDFPVSTSSAGGTSVSMSNQLPSENESTIEPGDGIVLSIPILSIYEIKKFQKQYLEEEKLLMLNPGIELVTMNCLFFKFCFAENCQYEADDLLGKLKRHSKLESPSSIFAYKHAQSVVIPKTCKIEDQTAPNFYQFNSEKLRLNLFKMRDLKLTEQQLCKDYPLRVFVPQIACTSWRLKEWANFHKNNCFPIVAWKSSVTSNVLMRAGMSVSPRGIEDDRNLVDEEIINEYSVGVNGTRRQVSIFTESGTENMPPSEQVSKYTKDCYPNCEVVYLENLPSLQSTAQAAFKYAMVLGKNDENHYLSHIEESGWLREISILLGYATCIATILNQQNKHVILSLGNGLDRTAQLSSLVQLLLDPFYRTLAGFQVLIQKEWLSIKHPFHKRNTICFSSQDEISPLFLQFLDCVYQLLQQFPTRFEFSNDLLEMLAVHSCSGRFDTFNDVKTEQRALSLWTYVNVYNAVHDNLYNFNYEEGKFGILLPQARITHLEIWPWFYQYRREEILCISRLMQSMEMEKLQAQFKELLDQHKKLLENISQVDLLHNGATYNSVSGKKHIFTKCGKSTRTHPANDLFLKWNSAEDLLSSSKSSPTFHVADSNNNKSTLRKGLSQSFKLKADYTATGVLTAPNKPGRTLDLPSSGRNYEQKYKESETYSNRTFSISTQDVNILKGYSNNINDFHSSDNGNYCDNPSDQDIKYISSSHIVKSKSSENLLSLKNSINELANAIRDNTSTILDKPSRQFSRISRFSRRNTPSGNTKGIREIRTAPNSLRWKDKKEGISALDVLKKMSTFPREKKRLDHIDLKGYLKMNGIEEKDYSFTKNIGIEVFQSSCCGYLIKQGNSYKSWKKRWFVLDYNGRTVKYYETSESKDPKGEFNCLDIRSVYPDDNQRKNYGLFYVETIQRLYPIKSSNTQLMKIWMLCFSVSLSNLRT